MRLKTLLYFRGHYFRMSKHYVDLLGHSGKRSTIVLGASPFAYQGLDFAVRSAAKLDAPGLEVILGLGCLCIAYVSGTRIYEHVKNGSYWLQKYKNK